MLKITVELWPGGDKSRAKVIATGEIRNTGGDLNVANYESVWSVPDRGIRRKGSVLRFPRLRRSVLELVELAIANAFGE